MWAYRGSRPKGLGLRKNEDFGATLSILHGAAMGFDPGEIIVAA